MAHARGKYADFETLSEQAVALRRAGLSLRQIRDEPKIYNNDILNRLVKGEPPSEWTTPHTGAARQGAQRAVEKRAVAHAEPPERAASEIGPVTHREARANRVGISVDAQLRVPPGGRAPERRPTPSHRRLAVRHSRRRHSTA
ncbi:hypothetical protein ABZ464_03190 [Streptomyces sp. NPDC005820]|uniref:hypothetical protein n=1 Tax=Streptomyces sp. NPDC005820 TaxID=3157069 RepID=UPI0033E943E8